MICVYIYIYIYVDIYTCTHVYTYTYIASVMFVMLLCIICYVRYVSLFVLPGYQRHEDRDRRVLRGSGIIYVVNQLYADVYSMCCKQTNTSIV